MIAPDFAILIPAAGKSLRYTAERGGRNKLAETLRAADGTVRSVLGWSAAAFLSRTDVGQLVIATGDEAGARELLGDLAEDGRLTFAPGGASRADSVRSALGRVRAGLPFVAVHDGARPLVSTGLIDRVFEGARAFGAAGPATAVALTIKQATGPLPATVERTVPRSLLWAMQTPQAMRADDLRGAFERCPMPLGEVTDDLQLLELAGLPARLVAGDEGNLKITHPQDLAIARQLLGG